MHFALKIFLGISFTGIFQIPVSRSTHKGTPGFIEFNASEHHKIGSDPFQSTTAFFHLVLMQCSSGGTRSVSL